MTEIEERVARAIGQHVHILSGSCDPEAAARAAIAAVTSNENTEIKRLRSILRRCMGGANVVDLGNGEYIALYLEEVDEAMK